MYILYATANDGKGYVSEIGRYKYLSDIEIRVRMFADDVVLTIKEEGGDLS